MITLDQYTTVRTLHQQGWTIKRLSRELGLARNTIRRALRQSYSRSRTRRAPTVLTPFLTSLHQRASQVHWNATRLCQDLRERGYAGSYDQVVRAVRPLREAVRLAEAATMRFETAPGQQAQVDWGSTWVLFGTARVRAHLFVMTLGYSRRCTVEATLDETLATFLACHERAFEWFGGMPKEILYDNPKTVVVQHDAQGRVLRWNPVLADFLGYYGVAPKACPLYRARTKGKVESGVKYVKRNFLPGRVFTGLADLNRALRTWVTTVADQRVHGTTHQRPLDRFHEEAGQLTPFGSRPPYVLPKLVVRRVAPDCLVDFETNRYSVPATYVGQAVEVRPRDRETVEVWWRGQVVATHSRRHGRFEWSVDPAHWGPLKGRPPRGPEAPLPPAEAGLVRPLSVYEEVAYG